MNIRGKYMTIAIIIALAVLAFFDIKLTDGRSWLRVVDEAGFPSAGSCEVDGNPDARRGDSLQADTSDVKRVRVSNPFGSTTVKGVEGSEIIVRYTVEVWGDPVEAEEFARKVKVVIDRKGNELEVKRVTPVKPKQISGVSVKCEIGCPKGLILFASNRFGALDIFGMEEGVTASNGFGSTTISRIKGDIEVDTSYGDLVVNGIVGGIKARNSFAKSQLSDITGKVAIEAKYGAVKVSDIGSSAQVKNSFGESRVASIDGDLDVEMKYGPLFIDGVDGDVKVFTKYGDTDVEGVRRKIEVESKAGKVTLNLAEIDSEAGYRFNVTAEKGHIHVADELLREIEGASDRDDLTELKGKYGAGKYEIDVTASMADIWITE